MQEPITITINERLEKLLQGENYGPAYDGESVGLDLYNTGPQVIIPPVLGAKLKSKLLVVQTESIKEAKARRKTLVPTGVRIALPRNTVALLRERGSVTKTDLILRAGVIDPGYTGEIFVNMVNVSTSPVTIASGAKLPVQLVVVPAFTNFEVVDADTYTSLTEKSNRADAMIGSSD